MAVAVAYVPSSLGRAALRAAIQEAQHRRTGLLVINATITGEVVNSDRFAQDEDIVRARAECAASGVTMQIVQPVGIDVARLIINTVKEHGSQVLVIGLKPGNPVGKLLLGSLSQSLLMECPIPVLAVKAAAAA